jgi:hypothetical protein
MILAYFTLIYSNNYSFNCNLNYNPLYTLFHLYLLHLYRPPLARSGRLSADGEAIPDSNRKREPRTSPGA